MNLARSFGVETIAPAPKEDAWMGFWSLFPVAAGVNIGKTFVFVHIDASGREVCVRKPGFDVILSLRASQ
jgi:hypothetical protein